MTSLAQQLQKLKIAQKDEIHLPERTRISFLFDIKQAANVDDQTLYYICLSGIRDLSVQLPELSKQLHKFQSDLLHEKSLEFYRGTQTKDTLKHIDEQLALLIKLLAPYFLNTSTHRILEYLIRVYEIHAIHKHLIVFSFLPYFETSFFLKIIQLLNLKQDELMFFLEPFAYAGDPVDKNSLIKGLMRNNGTLFTLYSEYCFNLQTIHQGLAQDLDNCLHWKFFGTMLIEIMRISAEDQTLLFNILPFINKGLKSNIRDLRLSALMGISQIACRRTLTREYAVAFFRQILISIPYFLNDDEVEKCIVVIILLSQFQRLPMLSVKDVKLFSEIEDLNRHFSKIFQSHDITALATLIWLTILEEKTVDAKSLAQIFKGCLNLKITYSIIESLVSRTISHEQQEGIPQRCHELLQILRELSDQDFNKGVLFLLRQNTLTESQREDIVKLLQGNNQSSHLVSKFGDKEYSLLSALSSQSKITKVNALNALMNPDLSVNVTQNERDLIKITLAQLISRNSEEESILQKVLEGYFSMIDQNRVSEAEFDVLENFLDSNFSSLRYSKVIIDQAVSAILKLRVTEKDERDTKQLMIGFSFDQIHLLYAKFSIVKEKSVKGDGVSEFIRHAVKDFSLSSDLALSLIKSEKSWINQGHVSQLVSAILEKSTANPTQINQFYEKTIAALGTSQRQNSQIITILITKMKKSTESQEDLLSSMIGQCLVEKQRNKDFDMRSLLQVMFAQILGGSQTKLAEFLIKIALESSNEMKKVFALISLTQIVKQKPISPQFIFISAIILLQDSSQLVREHTLNLLETYQKVKDDSQEIQVFTSTEKPQSQKKAQDKKDMTPLKAKSIQKQLKSFTALKDEIIADSSQMTIALNNPSNVSIIDSIVRFLLDLPSIRIKTLFIQSLKAVSKYSIIFGIGFQEQLNKTYFQIKQAKGTDHSEYIAELGSLIQKMCSQRNNEANEEFVSSLIFPYLAFVFQQARPESRYPIIIEEQLVTIFESNLLKAESLKRFKVENTISIMKFYVQSQLHLNSKILRQRIRDFLIDQTTNNENVLSEKQVAPLISDAQEKLSKSGDPIDLAVVSQLEIVLETLSQVRVQNEAALLRQLLDIITRLSQKKSDQSVFYLIELSVQLCIQITQSPQVSKANAKETFGYICQVVDDNISKLKQTIEELLNEKSKDLNDPFKQFIMEIDSQPMIEQEDSDKIMGVLQVCSSLINFQFNYEINALSTTAESYKLLDQIAAIIVQYRDDERSKSAKGRSLTLQIFRFYHQQVVRSTKSATKKRLDVKPMIATMIDTVLVMEEFGLSTDEMYSYLRQVLQEATLLIAFASLVLLCNGKSNISVKDNLELDSNEIKLVQRLFLDHPDILNLTEELMFFITCVPISEQNDSFVKQRLTLMFSQESVTARGDIVLQMYKRYIKNDREARRFKYLTIYLVNDWITKNGLIQKQMAYATQENPEKTNQVFYQIYLTSAVFNESVNQALQVKEYNDDKKVKKSLKRLHTRIQDFQKNLNNLLSYQVQVSIVLNVLKNFNDAKQTINIRTTTMQLLVNKTPQFAQSLSKVQEKEMTLIFTPLIIYVIQTLQAQLSHLNIKANDDKQSFILAMMSLLQRTASTLLNKEIKENILTLVLGFGKHKANFSLMLHSQLILTSMTLFEVNHLEILEHLEAYFGMLIGSFERVHNVETDFFVDSFTKTILKASLSLCTFFSKFLNANQYEQVIKNVLIICRPAYKEEVKTVLDVISKESTKNVGFKLVFQAMLNSYDDVIVARINGEIDDSSSISTITVKYFDDLFKQVIQRVKKEFIIENHKKIFAFFKNAFAITYTFFKTHGNVDMSNVREVEESIAQSYLQFVIKLNEEQLRPLIVKQAKFSFKLKSEEESSLPYNIHKSICFVRTMNAILGGLREFFVPLMPLYFDDILNVISYLSQQQQAEDKKRKRSAIDFNAEDAHNHTAYELLQVALKNIQLNFLYDTQTFIQNDTFEKLSEPLAAMVTLTQLGGEYNNFIENIIKTTVFDVVERINNDDMWKKINYDILMHTRNPSAQIRLGAFKVIEHLFNRIGERYLILLNDTIPFLSEGMEDENPDVEATAKSIVSRIEQMTGDSIHEYLK